MSLLQVDIDFGSDNSHLVFGKKSQLLGTQPLSRDRASNFLVLRVLH